MKNLILLIPLAVSAFVTWIFWGPVLNFLMSLIPETAEYAWVGKLICIILVGWFGGIGLPLAVAAIGIIIAIKLL